jgi:hypothetical protein
MEFSEQTRFTGSVAKARFSRSALGREFGARLLRAGNDQTMRDLGDVCGARNTQFEQEFLDLFRAETVSAYDGRDRIGDFCVADYLAELDTVHVMRYSTRFSLDLRRIAGLGGGSFAVRRSTYVPASSVFCPQSANLVCLALEPFKVITIYRDFYLISNSYEERL